MPEQLRTLHIAGDDFTAGARYGELAATEIRASIDRYTAIFANAGCSGWPDAVAAAEHFVDPIAAHAPDSLAHLRGIADGAGLQLGDVLALNTRSELMFQSGARPLADDGCTSVLVLPERSANGHMLLGQNWDWTVRARESLVLVARATHDRPGYITLVEAGLIAKTGFNTAGLGLCTNTLVSVNDGYADGLPYHVLLHQLIQLERVSDALQFLYSKPRALSANYLVAHADGAALNIETGPGGPDRVAALPAADGLFAHTNHFRDRRLALDDRRVRESAHTVVRLERIRRRLAQLGPKVDGNEVLAALTDHANYPLSVCLHPDLRKPAVEQTATLATLLCDLETGAFDVSSESPCANRFVRADLAEVLAGAALPAAGGATDPKPPTSTLGES